MNSADPWEIILRICFSFAPSDQQQAGVTCFALQEQHTALHAQISHCCHLARGRDSLLAHRRREAALLLVPVVCAVGNVWVSLPHRQVSVSEVAGLPMEVSNGQ